MATPVDANAVIVHLRTLLSEAQYQLAIALARAEQAEAANAAAQTEPADA